MNFRIACAYGNLELAKQIYKQNGYMNIHDYIDADDYMIGPILYCVCKNGHLEMAKWLYSLNSEIDIHIGNEMIFRVACEKGHFEIVRWLYYEIGNVNTHAQDEDCLGNIYQDDAFRKACINGHLEIAKWLYYEIGNVDIHEHINNCESLTYRNNYKEHIFKQACKYGHFETAKWLLTFMSDDSIKKRITYVILSDICRSEHGSISNMLDYNYYNDIKTIKWYNLMYLLYHNCEIEKANLETTIFIHIVKRDKQSYINNVIHELHNPHSQIHNLMNDPMFDINLFTSEIWSYLFYK